MSKYHSLKEAIYDNQSKKCSVSSCYNRRHRIGAFCSLCGRRRWYWGHPRATRISRKDYSVEKELVREIILKNLNHPGIIEGIKFLENWLEISANGSTFLPCAQHAARLYTARATGLELLIELSAVYLYSERVHSKVYDNRHLTYLLGSKFIRYIPYSGKTKGPEHRVAGEFLRRNIGVLLLTIVKGAQKMEKFENEKLGYMYKPLNV